jgi:MYXO-CTERM domain-containing protein
MVLLDVLPMAIAIQLSERLRGWRRNAVTGAFMALTPAIVGVVERAKEESARRRGVATAGDAPDWPPSPMLPMAAVAVGMAAAVMRRRRNTQAHPAERIVYPLAGRLVDEAALRWRWRHYPVLRD